MIARNILRDSILKIFCMTAGRYLHYGEKTFGVRNLQFRGLYIENTPPPREKKVAANVIGEKI
jgi:hypothetical protein